MTSLKNHVCTHILIELIPKLQSLDCKRESDEFTSLDDLEFQEEDSFQDSNSTERNEESSFSSSSRDEFLA